MKRAIVMIAFALLLTALTCSTTWAQFGDDNFAEPASVNSDITPMNITSTTVTPEAVTVENPDHTGYPYINNWKGGLNKDVHVFLNDAERKDLTQARVDETVAMQPVFERQASRLMSVLTPNQRIIFRDIVDRTDMETIVAMNDEDWVGMRAFLSQCLHLTASQEDALKLISNQLIADLAPIRAQYAGRFDTVIASAEQRVANRGSISTENK